MGDSPQYETALLLRVPPQLADQLRRQLHEESKPPSATAASSASSAASKSDLRVTFTSLEGAVHAQLSHGGAQMTGQLVNLPTVIELQKTFDFIHYYKCTEIGQMIVIQPPGAANATPSLNANPSRPTAPGAAAASSAPPPPPIQFPHGLLPPTRDIRPKRFDRPTTVPSRIVKDVEAIMVNLKEAKAMHTFELVEEVQEVDEEEEEEEGMDEGEEEEMEGEDEGAYDEGEGVSTGPYASSSPSVTDTGSSVRREPASVDRIDTSQRTATASATPITTGGATGQRSAGQQSHTHK